MGYWKSITFVKVFCLQVHYSIYQGTCHKQSRKKVVSLWSPIPLEEGDFPVMFMVEVKLFLDNFICNARPYIYMDMYHMTQCK